MSRELQDREWTAISQEGRSKGGEGARTGAWLERVEAVYQDERGEGKNYEILSLLCHW